MSLSEERCQVKGMTDWDFNAGGSRENHETFVSVADLVDILKPFQNV